MFSFVFLVLVCPLFGLEDPSASHSNETQPDISDLSGNGTTDEVQVEALAQVEAEAEAEASISARAPPVDVLRTCDSTFFERDFVLTSPNYPNPYADNVDCVAVVRRSSDDVCRLRLTFLFFSVQESPGCHLDSLNVNDDDDHDRLCGTLPPGTIREYSFAGSDIRLRFRSDAYENAGGFFLNAEQISCVESEGGICNAVNVDQQFDLTNANWPVNEGNVIDCTFTVRKTNSDICTLQLTFVVLQLDCRSEFLQIGPRRLCTLPKNQFQIVDFSEPLYTIRFHSDSANRFSRFVVKVAQLPCEFAGPLKPQTAISKYPPPPPSPPDVDQNVCLLSSVGDGSVSSNSVTILSSFLIRTSGFPAFYAANADCTFVVRKATPNICSLMLIIQDFDVEYSSDCDRDFLEVGGQRLCGILPQGSLRIFDFPNDEIWMRFVSDAERSGRGFGAAVSQRECGLPSNLDPPKSICDASYATGSFVIRPFYSDVNTCTFTVYSLSPNDCFALQLDFRLFALDCSDSFLEVKGDRLCGKFIEGTTRTYYFDGPSMRIAYQSGLSRSNFYVQAQQTPCMFGGGGQSEFSVPRMPDYNPMRCSDVRSVLVSRPSASSFRLVVSGDDVHLDCVHVAIKSSAHVCRLRLDFRYLADDDFVEVNGRIRVHGREVSSGVARNFDFLAPEIYIRVQVSNSRSADIQGTQLTCYAPAPFFPIDPSVSQQCNQTFRSPEVSLQFRRCPTFFTPSYFQCAYTIVKINADICNLDVEFVDFDLDNSPLCAAEFLDVGGTRFCGSISKGTIKRFEFAGNYFQLTYSTCSCGRGRYSYFQGGFTVLVRQIPCLVLPVHLTARSRSPSSTDQMIGSYSELVYRGNQSKITSNLTSPKTV